MLKYLIGTLALVAAATAAPGYLTGQHGHGALLGGHGALLGGHGGLLGGYGGYAHAAPALELGHLGGYSHGYAAAPALLHAAPITKIATTAHYAAPAIAHHSYAATPIIKSYAAPAIAHHSYATPIIKSYAAPAIAHHATLPLHASYQSAPLLGYGLHGLSHGAPLAHGW